SQRLDEPLIFLPIRWFWLLAEVPRRESRDEAVSLDQRRGVDPGHSSLPAPYRGRPQEPLAHPSRDALELLEVSGRVEILEQTDDQLDWTLDGAPAHAIIVEEARSQNCTKRPVDRVVVLAQPVGQGLDNDL